MMMLAIYHQLLDNKIRVIYDSYHRLLFYVFEDIYAER